MKIVAIIQARFDSRRLPGKVLMKIGNKSILEHIISFLKMSNLINEIIIATTTLPSDKIIVQLTTKLGIKSFCGSSENVLERFFYCATENNADLIIRITADDPLIDYKIIDQIILSVLKNNYDYASNVLNPFLPVGFTSCEVFTYDILKKLFETKNDKDSKEHVTSDIRKHPELYSVEEILPLSNLARPNWRLTIDYPEDLELINSIFEKLYVSNSYVSYEMLVKFLDEHKELMNINKKFSNLT